MSKRQLQCLYLSSSDSEDEHSHQKTRKKKSCTDQSSQSECTDSDSSDDDILFEDPLETWYKDNLHKEECWELLEHELHPPTDDEFEDSSIAADDQGVDDHILFSDMFSKQNISQIMDLINKFHRDIFIGGIKYKGQGNAACILIYTERNLFPLMHQSYYFYWLPVKALKNFGFNVWYRKHVGEFKKTHNIEEKKSFLLPRLRQLDDVFNSNLSQILKEQLKQSTRTQTSISQPTTQNEIFELELPNASIVKDPIPFITKMEWYRQFCIRFPPDSFKFDFLKSADPINLDTGSKIVIEKATDTGKRRPCNHQAIEYLANSVQEWIVDNPNNEKISSFGYTANNLLTLDTWRNIYPFIELIPNQLKEVHPEYVRESEVGICDSLNNYYNNVSTFLTWVTFIKKKGFVEQNEYFQLFLDYSVLESYKKDLEDKSKFGYETPNTIRRKLEPIQETLAFLSIIDTISKNILIAGNLSVIREKFNVLYRNTNSRRQDWIIITHDENEMRKRNQLIEPENFWKMNLGVYNILISWIHMYFSTTLKDEEKVQIILNHGSQFQILFSYWLILYTYANRSQYYYQSSIHGLQLYHFNDNSYRYYLVFNNDNNRLKSHRSTSESSFPLGSTNNLIVFFYKEILVPTLIGSKATSLFYSIQKKPITIFHSKGRGVSIILKRVTKQFTGIGITNQTFRLHYNTYLKAVDKLTDEEKRMIDRGMNHSKITADKHYQILSTGGRRSENPIIERTMDPEFHYDKLEKIRLINELNYWIDHSDPSKRVLERLLKVVKN